MYDRKGVAGFEDLYAVDTDGEVWTLRGGISRKMKPMVCGAKRKQYRTVRLCWRAENVAVKVGVLVLEAFVGPRPGSPTEYVMRHLNDDPLDDRLVNLSWGTLSQNCIDSRENYTEKKRNRKQKLTREQVLEIKQRFALGEPCAIIAQDYGVSHWTLYDINNGRAWKDVDKVTS